MPQNLTLITIFATRFFDIEITNIKTIRLENMKKKILHAIGENSNFINVLGLPQILEKEGAI